MRNRVASNRNSSAVTQSRKAAAEASPPEHAVSAPDEEQVKPSRRRKLRREDGVAGNKPFADGPVEVSLLSPGGGPLHMQSVTDDYVAKPEHNSDRSAVENLLTGIRSFPELSSLVREASVASAHTSKRIFVVTNELTEFHQNGGLGTATSGLLQYLVDIGCEPSVLYTAKLNFQSEEVRATIELLQQRKVHFQSLQELVPQDWMESPRKIAYGCYWFLRDKNPDIIHFNDYLGNGYYSAQAKRAGVAFSKTAIVTVVHGPTRWAMRIDQRPISSPELQEHCFLEERAIEFSDIVLGVSHHLLHWLKTEGVILPERTYVHKNILPEGITRHEYSALAPNRISEIVFFGRQDVRKGFETFLGAVRLIAARVPHVKFTFLGKFSHIHGEHSGAYALDELRNVSNLIDFRHNYDRDRAIKHLRRPGILAVIPSVDENSPCTVVECIMAGVPFIASKVGGIPELVSPEFHHQVLFEPNAAALAKKVFDCIENGYGAVSLASDPTAIQRDMVEGLFFLANQVNLETAAKSKERDEEQPLVSVVVTHFNRPHYLKELLTHLEKQTYSNFEVIVVDDGSTLPDAIAFIENLSSASYSYELTVVRTPNCYLGAARNAGAKRARGLYVKFQDDDNLPFPHELAHFVRAAVATNADIITGMSRFFRATAKAAEPVKLEELEYFPLGASLPLSLSRNEYGDANALVKTETFLKDGGFTELYGVGFEDHEFFLKSESLGRTIVFVPEPLFNYRVAGGSMLQSTSAYRGARRARSGLQIMNHRWLKELVDFAHDSQLDRELKTQTWWRAGARRFGELHQQMMEGDPNSSLNLHRFVELAVKYERFEDVVHIVARQNSLIESLTWLERQSKQFSETLPKRQFLFKRSSLVQFDESLRPELMEPKQDLPADWPVCRAGPDGVLVHPLTNRTTKVLLRGQLPKGAKSATVIWGHRGPHGSTVGIAIEVRSSGKNFVHSGWTGIDPGERSDTSISFKEPLLEDADLVLMSTVLGPQDFAWIFAEKLSLEYLDS